METLKTLILRIVAVFGSSALAAVAGGAVLNVELWKAAAIAGIVAAAKVTEALLRAWSSDGVLTKEELAEAFGKAKYWPQPRSRSLTCRSSQLFFALV